MKTRAFTLVETILASILAIGLMMASVAVLQNMQTQTADLKVMIDKDMTWIEASQHMSRMVHSASYFALADQIGSSAQYNTLILYNYDKSEKGRYHNDVAGKRLLYSICGIAMPMFNNVNATFAAPTPSTKGRKNGKLIEAVVTYSQPFASMVCLRCAANTPSITWAVMIGGPGTDNSYRFVGLKQTSDLGYIIWGWADDYIPSRPRYLFLIKLGRDGAYKWSAKYCIVNAFPPYNGNDIQEVFNTSGQSEGYLVCVTGMIPATAGEDTYNEILKVDPSGAPITPIWEIAPSWQAWGPWYDSVSALSAIQSFNSKGSYASNNYIFIGTLPLLSRPGWGIVYSIQTGGQFIAGIHLMDKDIPVSSTTGYCIQQTFNAAGNRDGYIIAGVDGDPLNMHICITKLYDSWDCQWSRVIQSGTNSDYAFYVRQIFDASGAPNGYVVGGCTGLVGYYGNGYVLRLDNSGNYRWSLGFPGWGGAVLPPNRRYNSNYFVVSTTVDGCALVGYYNYIYKYADDGTLAWQTTVGSVPATETLVCQQEAVNSSDRSDGYVLAANSTFTGSGINGSSSICIVKTDNNGNCPLDVLNNPTPIPITSSNTYLYNIGVPRWQEGFDSAVYFTPEIINKAPGDP